MGVPKLARPDGRETKDWPALKVLFSRKSKIYGQKNHSREDLVPFIGTIVN